MYDTVIIGSGPAGLSAGIYAARARLNAVILEEAYISGGQVLTTDTVENYPGFKSIGGFDLSMKMRAHAESAGISFIKTSVTGIARQDGYYQIFTDTQNFESRTVLIATGATHRVLGIPGEEAGTGCGVSYCATCDGAFYRGKSVAVIGGGNVAVEDAVYLARICEKVTLIHRRDALRAEAVLQESLFALPNVEICWNHIPDRITLTGGKVSTLSIHDNRTGEMQELAVSGVFIAVGITPMTAFCRGLAPMDDAGYLIAGEDGRTSVSGIYAAGDARKKNLYQIVTAVSDGANAIHSIVQDLT